MKAGTNRLEPPRTAMATGQKRRRAVSEVMLPIPQAKHPYLAGNFAPINIERPLTACEYTGEIPDVLIGGEYIRNGSNPVSNEDLGRSAHMFDGDGMLAGVVFHQEKGKITPLFVNKYLLSDVYLSAISSPRLRRPILPSIATLVNPLASLIMVGITILRTLLLVLLSHLPGSKQKIKKISVANTHIMYHDGRALALCESGPPLRVQLPELETVGWYNGQYAEGEPIKIDRGQKDVLGGEGMLSFMREWSTAHPKVDPVTKEMMLFHSSFAPPYVQYSILPEESSTDIEKSRFHKLLNAEIKGIHGAKMMHDFGCSFSHTIIMDLPLSLDPLEQLKGRPTVNYNASLPSRFGVFPRRSPEEIQYFETDACCIFHTANSWDTITSTGRVTAVNMLACRLTSATLVFVAGNIAPPAERKKVKQSVLQKRRMPFFSKYDQAIEATDFESIQEDEKEALIRIVPEPIEGCRPEDFDDEQCRLYYYDFNLKTGAIDHQWALSAVSFEFPSVNPQYEMSAARYIYGCSTTDTSFGQALGKATKIDILVKIDAQNLIAQGKRKPPASVTGVVDARQIQDVLKSEDPNDPIKAFRMPDGWYAQEPRFVAASTPTSEDDGYLLFYAFDEAQLLDNGDVPPDDGPDRSVSELWIIDAVSMQKIIGKVRLCQRVPYGLHGNWFNADQIRRQRMVEEKRTTTSVLRPKEDGIWMEIRDWIEARLG